MFDDMIPDVESSKIVSPVVIELLTGGKKNSTFHLFLDLYVISKCLNI